MAFVVFEGLDGSGKTSLIQKVKDHLSKEGVSCIVTREPGGTPLGDELRKVLLRTNAETPVPECELLLYEAIRAQHVTKVIVPALAKKQWILCDRFTASSLAFQAAGRHLKPEDVGWLNRFATQGVNPHLTVLLDISCELSQERQQNRIRQTGEAADRFELEKRDFHNKVRQSYLEQASQDTQNWFKLDAAKDVQTLFQELMDEFERRKWL